MVSDNGSIHYLYVIRIKCYHWNTSLCQAKYEPKMSIGKLSDMPYQQPQAAIILPQPTITEKPSAFLEKASDPMLKSNITIKEPISTNFKSEYPKAEITVLIISSNKGIPDTLKICYPMNTQFLPPQIARKDYLW